MGSSPPAIRHTAVQYLPRYRNQGHPGDNQQYAYGRATRRSFLQYENARHKSEQYHQSPNGGNKISRHPFEGVRRRGVQSCGGELRLSQDRSQYEAIYERILGED